MAVYSNSKKQNSNPPQQQQQQQHPAQTATNTEPATTAINMPNRNSSNNNNNGNKANQHQSGGTILDIIHEKTANIEQATNSAERIRNLSNQIHNLSKRERKLRDATITIKQNEHLKHDTITEIIEKRWIEERDQVPVTYWQDREQSYCQFLDKELKLEFLKDLQDITWAKIPLETTFKDSIINGLNLYGQHYVRKPVKIEIANVRSNIKADVLQKILETITTDKTVITQFKEGKPHNVTKSRSIFFRTNAEGIDQLLNIYDGAIPYVNKSTNTRVKLIIKINAKPWQCKDCLAFGQHQCQGKICNQCGLRGHETKDCKQKTKNCNNCKKRGHKAKDTHCPIYVNEVVKELRKMDIPLDYLEDSNKRAQLLNYLLIR